MKPQEIGKFVGGIHRLSKIRQPADFKGFVGFLCQLMIISHIAVSTLNEMLCETSLLMDIYNLASIQPSKISVNLTNQLHCKVCCLLITCTGP